MHTKIKNFFCIECNATFSRKNRLKIHMMIHKGERPFECNFCKKKFREKSNYNYHMKKHISKDPKSLKKMLNKRIFNKSDLVMEKSINNFYIKEIKKSEKSIDSSQNNRDDKNSISINENSSLGSKDINNDFTKNLKEKLKVNYSDYNSNNQNIIYELKKIENPLKLYEKDIYFNSNEKKEKDKYELKDSIMENELYNFSIYNPNNYKYLSETIKKNINYYDDELDIKNSNNLGDFEILMPNIVLESGKSNKYFEECSFCDSSLNIEHIF